MTILVSGRVSRGEWALSVDSLAIEARVTAVVGANGSGKTTLGRLVAGLDRLAAPEVGNGSGVGGRGAQGGSRDRVMIGDRIVDDPGAGVFVPAHGRGVGVVFQDHRLFAHLRAIDNVAFGLRRSGHRRTEARRRACEVLEQVGVPRAAWRLRPADLSGGQRQRVAVARALAASPEVLVADEPLASVDSPGRASLRAVLSAADVKQILLITHDPVDVWTMAQAVVALHDGAVVTQGTPEAVTASPAIGRAAEFLGANVVAGVGHGTEVTTSGGLKLTVVPGVQGPVHLTFPATAVTLHNDQPAGSARNVWSAEVTRVDIEGDRARVTLKGPVTVRSDITMTSVTGLGVKPGKCLWVSIKATEITATPA